MASSFNPAVRVCVQTWERGVHELFDHQANNYVQDSSITVTGSSRLVWSGNEIANVGLPQSASGRSLSPSAEHLLTIRRNNDEYWIEKQNAWLVVNEARAIQEGDTIKLGRNQFLVKQLGRKDRCALPKLKLDLTTRNAKAGPTVCRKQCSTSDGIEDACRYCLMPQQDTNDPLISPCLCRGGSQHVHLGCLRRWLQTKVSAGQGRRLFWQPAACELCQADFSTFVEDGDGIEQTIAAPPVVEPPFIVLEFISGARDCMPPQPGLHIVSLAGGRFAKLGRGSDTDVQISDVSLSRWHATIFHENGAFLLSDNNSKFGTLLKLRQAEPLEMTRSTSFQMGRTVVTLTMVPTSININALPTPIATSCDKPDTTRENCVKCPLQRVQKILALWLVRLRRSITSRWQPTTSLCYGPV